MSQTHEGPLAAFSFATLIDERQRTLHSRKLMLALSYVIEDIAGETPSTTLIAAFQRYQLVRPQLARYTRLTPQLRQSYLIGIPDAEIPALPNTELIPIQAGWPLLHEWVVLAIGPACSVGLVARDLEAAQPAQQARQFQGSWTTDPALVDSITSAFFTAIGRPPPAFTRDARATSRTTQRVRQVMQERTRAR
jgi:DICT domain-containing protein